MVIQREVHPAQPFVRPFEARDKLRAPYAYGACGVPDAAREAAARDATLGATLSSNIAVAVSPLLYKRIMVRDKLKSAALVLAIISEPGVAPPTLLGVGGIGAIFLPQGALSLDNISKLAVAAVLNAHVGAEIGTLFASQAALLSTAPLLIDTNGEGEKCEAYAAHENAVSVPPLSPSSKSSMGAP